MNSGSSSSDVARVELLDGQRLLTAEQVAARWQVSKFHVYRLAREGKVPTVAIGSYYRLGPRLASLAEWEEAGGVPRR
jgi:excisionase family DNA binding protein